MVKESMKYHILTPFSRVENREAILKNFHRPNVIFHPIINTPIEFPKEDWIQPFTFVIDSPVEFICYYALNKFLDANTLVEDEYYWFLSDDDFIEPDFFEKIKGIDSDFIMVSCKRGDHRTNKKFSPSTGDLICKPSRMALTWVGGEQLLIKGKRLQNERFIERQTGDGNKIRRLWDKYHHVGFTFVPDAFVWFNYLEPGRWDNVVI